MDRMWYLRGSDVFAGLGKEKELFLRKAGKLRLKKHDMIFFEGDPGNCCYYLASGLVRIFSVHGSGKEPVFFLRHSGELFGISEVLEGYPRNANAQAMADVELYKVGKEDFDALLRENYVLARRIITLLGCRVRHLGDTIYNLVAGSVENRLGKLLVALAYGLMDKSRNWTGPVTLPMRISQEQLAQLAGSTQPTISELLKKFQRQGLISVDKRLITLLEPEALLDISTGKTGD